jgi:hypothetical protein
MNKANGLFSVSCFCTSLIFVNNAGTYPSGAIYEITPKDLPANIRLGCRIDSGLQLYGISCGRFKKIGHTIDLKKIYLDTSWGLPA